MLQLSKDIILPIDEYIENLFGRIPIEISKEKIAKDLEGKCILITGAAGSVGSEIVRQIACFNPKLVLLCDNAETHLYNLQLELLDYFPELRFLPIICDVRYYNRMEQIFQKYHPEIVYHAAAYKHVPLMEDFPSEAILVNVLGSKNIADLAIKHSVETFVMISTDKAVNPTNVMGASKRIAEIYIQSLSKQSLGETKIITTRFGNVLGSNGSVIPLFKDQIEKGGPVTVTHPDVIRYFMTIQEACCLVLEAGNLGKGGELFFFDMGEPMKILDLAKEMIRFAGLEPDKDIEIRFTGLRPGEKLFEELLLANKETLKPTSNKKIMIGTVNDGDYSIVTSLINDLIITAEKYDDSEVLRLMKQLVPEYNRAEEKE